MLNLVGLLGLAAFVAASGIVGVRILLLARKTRGLPEILIGSSLVIAGSIGTALAVLPLVLTDMSDAGTLAANQAANVANHVGYALLFLFVWRVFRPGVGWAAVLFFACALGLVVSGAGVAMTLELGESISRPTGPARLWILVSIVTRLIGYVWASVESLRYYGKLKRRAKLGLSDLRTANRFFYWGVCTSAVVGIWLNLGVEVWAIGIFEYAELSRLISAVLGFVVAGSLSLAFFPGQAEAETTSSEAASTRG